MLQQVMAPRLVWPLEVNGAMRVVGLIISPGTAYLANKVMAAHGDK